MRKMRKYDMDKTVYGISFNRKTGKHNVFGRNYYVLPVQFTPEVLEAVLGTATGTHYKGRVAGHGKYRIDLGKVEDCEIVFLGYGARRDWDHKSSQGGWVEYRRRGFNIEYRSALQKELEGMDTIRKVDCGTKRI